MISLLRRLLGKKVEQQVPEFPKPCILCTKTIWDKEDLIWHGLGECVDLCAHFFSEQELHEETDCVLCKGEGSVEVARRKGLVPAEVK